MTPVVEHCHFHPAVQATFKGVVLEKDGIDIVEYRGLQFGSIAKRFAKPELAIPLPGEEIDGTEFGPRCPQSQHDIRQLFGIPNTYPQEVFEQDEFNCLNMTLAAPLKVSKSDMPVMIWIHGGGQFTSVEGPGSRMSDISRLVADSVSYGRSIIVVAINYRLNIFGMGDGTGERNLALQDQSCAIEWVRRYIRGFGGSPENITLAGESAGGLYIHAHSIIGTPAKRMILQSGTLYTIPPLSLNQGAAFHAAYQAKVHAMCGRSVREAPAEILLQALVDLKINSMWLELTPDLEGWQHKSENIEEVMIGDCEFESILWLDILRKANAKDIVQCFDTLQKEEAIQLMSMYSLDGQSARRCRQGAMNLIGDYKFAQPSVKLVDKWRKEKKSVFHYLVDEVNPFRESMGAHHGIDLLYLFGDYDLSPYPNQEKIGQQMRRRWILFINGEVPWKGSLFSFGPNGRCNVVQQRLTCRSRRWDNFQAIEKLRPRLDTVINRLTHGRIQNRQPRI